MKLIKNGAVLCDVLNYREDWDSSLGTRICFLSLPANIHRIGDIKTDVFAIRRDDGTEQRIQIKRVPFPLGEIEAILP